MIDHQELVKEIAQELSQDDNVLMLILYGSVSRHEEGANSDIDLMMITKSCDFLLQKRQTIRRGIAVEFLEMPLDYLHCILSEKLELPIFVALVDGSVLFDKTSMIEQLRTESVKIIETGPPANTAWQNERYSVKRRSDITEIYKDLLDVDEEISFNYIVTLLINSTIPLFYENNALWHTTKKKTMGFLKSHCYEGYQHIEVLLSADCSMSDKRHAAKALLEYVFKPYGGIVTGDAILFEISRDTII